MTSTPRAPATATLLSKVKRVAKRDARATGIQHTQALEDGARAAGYSTFHELQQACTAPPVIDLPIDPKLRPMFDATPNERRSKMEIDTWWDRPFAHSQPDGSLLVRCLDGGAWDRSTWYGSAPDLPSAIKLAQEKLAKWRGFREAPLTMGREDGGVDVVRMPQRPDRNIEVLYEAKDHADAAAWIAQSTTHAAAEDSAVRSNSESGNGAG